MKFDAVDIDFAENLTGKIAHPHPFIRILPGAKIIRSKVLGPLYLSRYTVKEYLSNVYEKLSVKSRTQLVALVASRSGT